jgi:7-cyano-7-deazaguanine reductase
MAKTQTKKSAGRRKRSGGLTLLGQNKSPQPQSPDEARLEAFDNTHPERNYWITLDCPEFTALCPITGQPDFAHITIRYVPDTLCVESKSLKLYLGSFRNTGTFHEAVINRILDDLVTAIAPRKAVVKGAFNQRGGIAIIVEATHEKDTK